jgi:hypothetical protein
MGGGDTDNTCMKSNDDIIDSWQIQELDLAIVDRKQSQMLWYQFDAVGI